MKLQWERRGVLRATLKVQELATLVAGARMAAAALAGQSPEPAAELERLIENFDRAATHLGRAPTEPDPSSPRAPGRRMMSP